MLFPPSAGRIAHELVSAKPPGPRPSPRSEPHAAPRFTLSLVPPFKLLRPRAGRLPAR